MADEESINKSIRHDLSRTLSYSNEGDIVEGKFIELRPPSSRNRDECAKLKQAFFRSLPKGGEQTQEAESQDSSEPTGDEVMIMLSMSNEVDLAEVLRVGVALFTKGKVAFIDGEKALTSPKADELSLEDLESMVGKYLVGFILRSALRKLSNS